MIDSGRYLRPRKSNLHVKNDSLGLTAHFIANVQHVNTTRHLFPILYIVTMKKKKRKKKIVL